jgi:hypothetical protein
MADLPRFLVRRCSKQSEPGLTFHKEGQRRGTQIRAGKEPGDLNVRKELSECLEISAKPDWLHVVVVE